MKRSWVFLVLGLVWSGCTPDETAPPSARSGGPQPQQQFFNYRLIESRAGVRHWVLESDEMQKFAGQEDVLLVTVRMDFFREGELFSVLTADSGRADLDNRNVHTWGTVVVETTDGRRLETEELFFDNQSQLITNEVFDRLTRDTDVMTGIGLEATPDLEYIELKRDVKAEVRDASVAEGDGT